jgi:hypothetical protein
VRLPTLATWLLIASTPALAQTTPSPAQQHHHPAEDAAHALFPSREASGTAWLPDETPMFGIQRKWRGWDIMLHGAAVGQLLYEPGYIHRTGGFSTYQFGSVNWGMAAARRRAGPGRFGLRAMLSAEQWTLRDCGSINLLATGEICDGDTIHDRQHPHDLFMELAADYDRSVRGDVRMQLYAALAGEPALGPAGFPHRVSAALNPVAPIAHHWIDSSHISFGVVTAGLYNQRWKGEVSLFNGREPDTNRSDLDLGALDSISGRVSWIASRRLSLQVSAGHLNEAEAEFGSQPRNDVNRFTASATWHRPLGVDGLWASTFAYGLNSAIEIIPEGSLDPLTSAALVETTVARGRHAWFGRLELVEKPAHDLHAHAFSTRIFTVFKGQAGYVYELPARRGIVTGFGGTAAFSVVPPELSLQYDGRVRPSFGVFISVRPPRHVM